MLEVVQLQCEAMDRALGIDNPQPRFSWALQSGAYRVLQRAYRIQVARDGAFQEILWDSGWKSDFRTRGIPYEGVKLQDRSRFYYRIQIRSDQGEESPWSEVHWFETALVDNSWGAPFIGIEEKAGREQFSCPQYLRRVFTLDEQALNRALSGARLYITALGLYEVYLNGKRVGDGYFTPGWTSYDKRLQYQTYEVGSLLHGGNNVIAVILANGWYRGHLTWFNEPALYGEDLAVSLCLYSHPEASEPLVQSDEAWQWTWGPLEYAELYHGERYDARQENPRWFTDPSSIDGAGPCRRLAPPPGRVVAQTGPLVQRQETLSPIAFFTTPRGERVLDFGQNLTGWVRFRVQAPAGSRVVLRHAEILDRDGNFYTENLRKAKNTIEFICRGEGEEVFEPRFSFQGFRYVQLVEWPGEVKPDHFTAQVLHSQMEGLLDFSCSHPLLNQLHHNILWGWKGNSLDVPTDCPQRDERLGWTGDAQVFIGTASYLMDVRSFFHKWLHDLAADQLPDGGMPFVIPDVLSRVKQQDPNFKGAHSSTGWGDAAVVCPWTLYQRYGDREELRSHYPAMKKWVDLIHAVARDGLLWMDGFHFGDWVALDAKEGSYLGATPNDLTASAYYAYVTEFLSRSAAVLGYTQDARYYEELHTNIVAAFQKEFITETGRLVARTQTAHILVLSFNLCKAAHRRRIAADLAALIQENHNHLTTGFLGTPLILKALSENGYLDLAYTLLLQEDYPSWLYQITKGATTIWEHWDGLKPDGSFWSPDMNSFNHYAYGSVGQWIYENLAGLTITHDSEGRMQITIAPKPGPSVDWARLRYRSVQGEVMVSWEKSVDRLRVECTIPPNCLARFCWPGTVIERIEPEPLVLPAMGGNLQPGSDITEAEKSVNGSGPSVPELQLGSGHYIIEGK